MRYRDPRDGEIHTLPPLTAYGHGLRGPTTAQADQVAVSTSTTNAAAIAHAVNRHDLLVSALRGCLRLLSGAEPPPPAVLVRAAMAEARAALAGEAAPDLPDDAEEVDPDDACGKEQAGEPEEDDAARPSCSVCMAPAALDDTACGHCGGAIVG